MTKLKKLRYATYLAIGLTVFCVWAGANYYNYTVNQQQAQVQITENVTMIDDTVLDIEMEQHSLERVQRRLETPPPSSGITNSLSRLHSPNAVAPTMAPTVVVNDALQDRIDQLEAEKKQLEAEKKEIVIDIQSFYDIFTFGAGNPMVNIVVLPLLFYVGKRTLGILFDKLEEKYEHHESNYET